MALGQYLGSGASVTKVLYHLDGDATDSSGNGANGTPSNVTWGNGAIGSGSVNLNGTNGYVDFGNVAGFEYNQAFTVVARIYHDGSANKNIFSKQENSGAYRGYGISTDATGKIQVFLYGWNGSVGGSLVGVSPSTYANAWYDLIFAYDGSNTFAGLKLYVNGSQVTLSAAGNLPFNASILSTASLQISGRGGANGVFSGKADECFIESGEWPASKAAKYHTYSSGRFATI